MIGKQILEEERGHRKLERTTKGGGAGGGRWNKHEKILFPGCEKLNFYLMHDDLCQETVDDN